MPQRGIEALQGFDQPVEHCSFPGLSTLSARLLRASTCLQPSEHTEVINDARDHPENIPGSRGPRYTARILLLWPH